MDCFSFKAYYKRQSGISKNGGYEKYSFYLSAKNLFFGKNDVNFVPLSVAANNS